MNSHYLQTAKKIIAIAGLSLSLIATWGCNKSKSKETQKSPQAASVVFPPDTVEETNCLALGWSKVNIAINSLPRKVLWKEADSGVNTNGSIVILHGGGGKASHFCSSNEPAVQAQIAFATLATQQGFGVYVLDSTDDIVKDAEGDTCGKRFDFPIQNRANVDMDYIGHVIQNLIPSVRPAGSSTSIYMAGHSTGGFMTIHAATHFDAFIKAFTPIAAGDPYGTYQDCDPTFDHGATGLLKDNETDLNIAVDNSCLSSPPYLNENPWETSNPISKPKYKQFHSLRDGIVDTTCMQKAGELLTENGYDDDGVFLATDGTAKALAYHYWRVMYNQPILDFFKSTP